MRAHRATRIVLVAGLVLLLYRCATADAGVKVWGYSKQNGSGQAEVGGGVSDAGSSPPSSGGSSGGSGTPDVSYAPPSSGGTGTPTYDASAPPVTGGETVPFDPNFRGAMQRPPGVQTGTACLYFPEAPGACPVTPAPPETLRGRRGRARAAPPIDPYAVAESIARSMPLLPGEVRTDPASRGWAGVATWFWLEPAPRTIAAVAVLGAERIVVTAVPSPAWNFGDGAAPEYGAGRPYRRGAAPVDGAVAHRYETRCLPGDLGRNPYVLDSCSDVGYRVEANVTWTISFVATGPVPGAGTLPSRTTTATAAYPVNEVRSFLSSDRDGGGPS
jgi:hypothetical protein